MADRMIPIQPIPFAFGCDVAQTPEGPVIMLSYQLPTGDLHLFADIKSATEHAKEILAACRDASASRIVTPPKGLIIPNGTK